MNRCKTCKHWTPERADEWGSLLGAGECKKAPQIWDVTNQVEDETDGWRTNRVLKPEHAAVLAVVEDGSAYSARLITMPDFGCVQHEGAKAPVFVPSGAAARGQMQGNDAGVAAIDTADHVKHGPSGEEWVVARATSQYVYPCGWPPCRADLADCTLIKKAAPDERANLMRDLAAGDGYHAAWAKSAIAAAGVRVDAPTTNPCPECASGHPGLVDVSGDGDYEACEECGGTGRVASGVVLPADQQTKGGA